MLDISCLKIGFWYKKTQFVIFFFFLTFLPFKVFMSGIVAGGLKQRQRGHKSFWEASLLSKRLAL
jgi:hypothetical protein